MQFKTDYQKFEVLNEKIYKEEDTTKKSILLEEFNSLYKELIKISFHEKELFSSSSLEQYKEYIVDKIKENNHLYITFNEVDFLKQKIEINFKIKKRERYMMPLEGYFYLNNLDEINYKIFKNIINDRIIFLEQELFIRGYEVTYTSPNGNPNTVRINYLKSIERIIKYEQDSKVNSKVIEVENKIKESIEDFNFNKDLPYKIALLNEIGFFEMDSIRKLTKESQYKIISKLTGGTIRAIKGNVLVLNPNSTEDTSRYTSNNHIDIVKLDLDKLK
jgi:hypothetical protein